jgi:ketosteroid isomerase-like protein
MELSQLDLEALRILKDRFEIMDCIHRYCRGIDRGDRALALSAYHPDAIDDHGVFVEVASRFVDWALSTHLENQVSHQHAVTNHSCELDGDTAHAETYFLYQGTNRSGPDTLSGGRYVDRFERRAGKWAIAARVCVVEWISDLGKDSTPPDFKAALTGNGTRARNTSDISYMRPLRVTRPTTG